MPWQDLSLWKIIPSKWLTCWRGRETSLEKNLSNERHPEPGLKEWDLENRFEYEMAVSFIKIFSLIEAFSALLRYNCLLFVASPLDLQLTVTWKRKTMLLTLISLAYHIDIFFLRKFDNVWNVPNCFLTATCFLVSIGNGSIKSSTLQY